MPASLIENTRYVQPGEAVVRGSVLVQDKRIAVLDPKPGAVPPDAARIDAGGALLTPGLMDVHTHGMKQFMYQRSPEELIAGTKLLPGQGTTCILPTILPKLTPTLFAELEALADTIDEITWTFIPGFHLEGPFLKLSGAACPTMAGDLNLLDELLSACKHRVTAMSIAPDAPNILPVIERLVEQNILPFITHTRASIAETQAALDAGARHATHFYNVFPVPEEYEPGARAVGAVEAILADPRATVDFICDGVHVHPVAIKAALAAKSYRGVILITDAGLGSGEQPGEYDTPLGFKVRIREGDAARISDPEHPYDGCLCGSVLTMNAGMRNLLDWIDLPEEQIWAMGTANPARIMGLANKGAIRVGADADLVLWDAEVNPIKTWLGGRVVYDAAEKRAVDRPQSIRHVPGVARPLNA